VMDMRSMAGQQKSGSGHRRRARAAAFVLVWSLPGLWPIAHAHAHAEHHPAEHSEHAEPGGVVGIASADSHGHLHPDEQPAISSGKAPELKGSVVPASSPEFAATNAAPLRWTARSTPARASPRVGPTSGPRAPPLS
jgi:hypothetical protein